MEPCLLLPFAFVLATAVNNGTLDTSTLSTINSLHDQSLACKVFQGLCESSADSDQQQKNDHQYGHDLTMKEVLRTQKNTYVLHKDLISKGKKQRCHLRYLWCRETQDLHSQNRLCMVRKKDGKWHRYIKNPVHTTNGKWHRTPNK